MGAVGQETGKIVPNPMTAEVPVSRTKIVVPTLRPEILHRARLLGHFDDLLDTKLIIIAAPAGYGKTSLLVDYARQSDIPVCWLSLDALDKDPQRFCVYLIAALEQHFPKFGKQSRAALGSLASIEQDAERLLSVLVNEIYDQVDQHFALVVDDFQFVDAVPDIRNLFSRFIYLVGENCHIILSTRRLPTLPDITLMVARQQVGGFDLEELAFRPNEIRSLFKINYGLSLSDRAVEELTQQTEGWITGLQLSASNVANDLPDLTRASRAAGVDLAGYLDQQVLASQPPKLRKFMLHTSLLEEFDADLCGAVFGKGDWKSMIKTIRQDNLFVLPVGPGGKWIRYHHLFQEFLQQRVREEDPENVEVILLRLGDVYKERREWEKAYAIYHASGNLDTLADLIELAGIPMLMNERLITLRAWLEELPARLLEEHPLLLSLKGALLCALGEGKSALRLLDQAIPRIEKAKDLAGLALAHVRRSAAHRLVGDYASSLHDSDEALRLCQNIPDLQAIYAEAERFKGLSLYHLGRITDSIHFLEDALLRYTQFGETQGVARIQTELGMAYRAIGNYKAAQNGYEQALAEWRRENNMYSQANVLNNLGVLYHNQGKYEQALRTFEAGLDCVKFSHSLLHESLLLTSLGDVYRDLDEYESAEQAYAAASNAAHQISYQFLINYLSLAKTRLRRLRGKAKDAWLNLVEAESIIHAGGSNYEHGLFYLEHGCLQLTEENHATAILDLRRALDYFTYSDLPAEIIGCHIWLAAAYLRSGKVAAARNSLQTAFKMGQSESVIFSLTQAIRQARPWLSVLKADAEIGPALTTWLKSVRQAEAQLPALRKRLRRSLITVPIQAPNLTIRAFGKTHVRVNGKLVTSAQWKTASVRELFFYILAASHPMTKEEIGATLWPDLDTSQFRLRFKNEMYRLRHALGHDVILFENDRYYFNRLLDYEYDVESFTIQLNKAKAEVPIKKRITHLRAAINLWSGPYLQDVDATWIWPEREHLEQTYVDALEQLAVVLRKDGDLQAALHACHEALNIDPCRENIHCLAMRLHAEEGNRLAVIWQYQACRAALRSELGVDLSKETETLYRQLIA
jgi:LuxR family transcriptional regulator, maltose regulon positive regulatory protein